MKKNMKIKIYRQKMKKRYIDKNKVQKNLDILEKKLDKEIEKLTKELTKENEDLKSLLTALENDEVVFHTDMESFLKAGQ
jgi:hypothetical protein